jgi:hypothetical protein
MANQMANQFTHRKVCKFASFAFLLYMRGRKLYNTIESSICKFGKLMVDVISLSPPSPVTRDVDIGFGRIRR